MQNLHSYSVVSNCVFEFSNWFRNEKYKDVIIRMGWSNGIADFCVWLHEYCYAVLNSSPTGRQWRRLDWARTGVPMFTLLLVMGPMHVFYSSVLLLLWKMTHWTRWSLRPISKAKILIFTSVMEITQVFTIFLLLIRIKFKCTWQKIPQ